MNGFFLLTHEISSEPIDTLEVSIGVLAYQPQPTPFLCHWLFALDDACALCFKIGCIDLKKHLCYGNFRKVRKGKDRKQSPADGFLPCAGAVISLAGKNAKWDFFSTFVAKY